MATGFPADGATISDLADRIGDIWISIVVRDAQLVTVRENTQLRAGDDVVVLADPEMHEQLAVEAAARCGEAQLAAAALNRLQLATAVDGSDWAAGVEARSRALLAEGRTADSGYAEAVERLGNTRLRLELARTRLLYGEWLRRDGRRVDAREQLRPAHDTFAMIGAEAFADRARRELLATGEKVRKREVDTVNQLTPQEEHIARLARDGHTNPEIAAELFISARTVEWHLRKVFAKLDVTNRRGLKEALPDRRQPYLAGQRG